MLGSMSYERAITCADEFKLCASTMDRIFEELNRAMIQLREDFQSAGASELYATYDSIAPRLRTYSDKVRAFENFLRSAVAQYQADDAALGGEV